MSATPVRPRPRRRWRNWAAGAAILAVVATAAVVANGYDSRETPREDPSIWVERASGQYARVNTETAEIDTVRVVENPSAIVQSDGLSLLLTQGYGRAWTIDPTSPRDIQEDRTEGSDDEQGDGAAASTAPVVETQGDAPAFARTPEGTRQVIAAGGSVLFHTETGEAHLARVTAAPGAASAELGAPVRLDPLAGAREQRDGENGEDTEDESYTVAAAALDASGLVALYSPAERGVRWVESATGRFRGGVSEVPAEVLDQGVQLAIVSGKWVLFDAAEGRLWQEGGGFTELELRGEALLQGSSTAGAEVLVADEGGLWAVDRDGAARRVVEADGVPARPQQADGMVAAWAGSSTAALWTETGGLKRLELDGTIDEVVDPAPVIRTNGSRAVVVETQSGMVWTAPEGRLIPVDQWTLVDPPKNQQGEVVAQDVAEQEPPVAVGDEFGVRAGEPALLPVLLNDYDPNRRDVLTIVPEGLGDGLPADFGTVALLSDAQALTVHPGANAAGSATFSYRITDGVHVSEPAAVTLTVAADAVNTAPEWCPLTGCQRSWPSPEIAPGGTLVLPLLEGWIDPQGDPMMLVSAAPANADDPLRALVTADGRLAVRHTDPNAAEGDLAVRVVVSDSRGAQVERELRIRVRPGATIDFAPVAATVKTTETTILRPLERVMGGSGSFQLVDATVQQGSVDIVVSQGSGTIEATAQAPGTAILAVTVRDTLTEQEASSTVRLTIVESRGLFGVPPLRAFVRPLADTTIDVLSALPGANARALTVQSATVRDGQLRADVIEHSRIRVSGSTPDGQPGRIGSVDVVIAEGDTAVPGRLTVFQVAEAGSGGAIAVADTATVRAGSVVDIPVLDNDVAPPGERLVLHPEVGAPGAPGELAFASGSRVRYLAPEAPGTYTLSYTTYGASSPEQSDVGHVRVTVLPAGANRPPQPATVTVRVAPGERISTTVPLSNVDPDGDRVRLVSVDAPADPQLSAIMLARSSAIQVEASMSATRGTHLVPYTVRDAFGGEARGTMRVIVTDPDPGGGAPVVYSDYVRIARGASDPATVRPLDNDIDPAGGRLELVSVVPNVPGGAESPLYAELQARLDLSELEKGVVRIAGSDELGTVSFKYTVRSSASTSTADGLIVVQVSERIGLQAPAITDTVLSVRDRADFERVGVDVVTDRVRWAAGDVSTLTLSLWGPAADRYSVNGSSIMGGYRAEGDLVTFRLSGVDATGAEVESFGFLVVPPLDELRLSFKPGLAPVSVNEDRSVDVQLAELIDLGPGDRIELAQEPLQTQRSQASCVATGAESVRYSAGREAPWSDSCTIRVRLVEQNAYTLLSLPISIVPDDPVVQLNPLTRTIAPGETQTIELADMVAWQGGRAGSLEALRWSVSPVAAGFEVVSTGSTLQVLARADAVPGSQQAATVTVAGAGESQSTLTLRVGEAAVDAPRGATVALQCTVGSNCQVSLVGQPGEHDPFAGKPGGGLQLVSVDGSSCAYGALQAVQNSVQVAWSDARGPGGRCSAGFTVRDAQGRIGTGTIEFDAQGVPRAPASISLVAFTESSVTLEVVLGDAANAHPATTGVVVNQDGGGSVGSCAPSGGSYRCDVTGLNVGERHQFTARAVNGVGESDPTSAAEAWAYQSPATPNVTRIEQVSAESPTSGTVEFDISTTDPTTDTFIVTAGGVTQTVPASTGTVTLTGLPVGDAAWSVTPVSRFQPPLGAGGNQGNAATGTTVVGGLPTLGDPIITTAPGSSTVEVTVVGEANFGAGMKYGARTTGSCTASLQDDPEFTLTGTAHHTMTFTVCVRNEWGTAAPTTHTVQVGGEVPQLTGNTYSVGTAPVITAGANASYTSVAAPSPTPLAGYTVEYRSNGNDATISTTFPTLSPNGVTTIEVRQRQGSVQSAWAPVNPATAPTTVVVNLATCIVDPDDEAELRALVSQAARSSATLAYDEVAGTLAVSWTGAFSSLAAFSAAVPACP